MKSIATKSVLLSSVFAVVIGCSTYTDTATADSTKITADSTKVTADNDKTPFAKRLHALGFMPFARPLPDVHAGTLMSFADGREVLSVTLSESSQGRTNPVVKLPLAPTADLLVSQVTPFTFQPIANRAGLEEVARAVANGREVSMQFTDLYIEIVYEANLLAALNTEQILNTFWGQSGMQRMFVMNRILAANSVVFKYQSEVMATPPGFPVPAFAGAVKELKLEFVKPLAIGYSILEVDEKGDPAAGNPRKFELSPVTDFSLKGLRTPRPPRQSR